jgi:hypothetical protein
MTIARRVTVIAAAVVAALVVQPGFAVSKTVIPITKSKPAPSTTSTPHPATTQALTSTPHPATTQALKPKISQAVNGHHH